MEKKRIINTIRQLKQPATRRQGAGARLSQLPLISIRGMHIICICILLIITACGDDDHGSGTLPPDTRTPLTISGPLTVAATPGIAITRTDAKFAAEFFKPGDELLVNVMPIVGSSTGIDYTFIYTAAGTWEQPAGETPIYYEDVHNGTAPTHEFYASFGSISADQRTLEDHHQSDLVFGELTLTDERTLVAENPFERQGTLLVVRLSRPAGDAWTDARFQEYLESDISKHIYTTDGRGYQPLAGWNADLGVMEYRAIVPSGYMKPKTGWKVLEFNFNKPGLSGVTHTLKADATDIFENAYGKMYTLNATYNPRGTFTGNLTFNIAPWKDATIATPGTAQTAAEREKERFIKWITNDGLGGVIKSSFTLACDINISDVEWKLMTFGSSDDKDYTFDGGGHTITGLTVDVDDYDTGLFTANFCTIQNLHLRGGIGIFSAELGRRHSGS